MQKRNSTQEDHRERVAKVLEFVRCYHHMQISLSDLADVAAHSPFHFERVFQEQTGVKAMQHVRNVRLLRAAIDLRLTDRKIVNIALDAGYANHESFSRAFRAQYGESPRQFRKQKILSQDKKGEFMNNVKVGLVKISVTDFSESTTYYREVVGLEEEFAVPAYGWAQYKTNNMPLVLWFLSNINKSA